MPYCVWETRNALDAVLEELHATWRGEVIVPERGHVAVFQKGEVVRETRLFECRRMVPELGDQIGDEYELRGERVTGAVSMHLRGREESGSCQCHAFVMGGFGMGRKT